MKRRTGLWTTVVNSVEKLWKPRDPPFKFPLQIGDPVLRMRAEKVKPEDIKSEKIEKLLKNMRHVLDKTESLGISAPQVGIPLRIFMTQLTAKGCRPHSERSRSELGIEPWPLKIFINPEVEIIDNTTRSWPEGCISLLGFTASVPRFLKVKLQGLNEKGEPVSWTAGGFAARVIQHEMDHLNGMMYVDRMDTRTFEFCKWDKARNQRLKRFLP